MEETNDIETRISEELQERESENNEHEIRQSINDQVTLIKIEPREMEKFDLVFYSNIKDKIQELIISHSPLRKGLKLSHRYQNLKIKIICP